MDRLEDELAIRNRYAAYCFAADDRDPEAMADCFVADAEVDVVGRGVLRGRDAIAGVQKTPSTNRHLALNLWVQALDGASARVAAYFLVLDAEGAPVGHGRYQDELRREADGAWRFHHRSIRYAWQAETYGGFVSQVVAADHPPTTTHPRRDP